MATSIKRRRGTRAQHSSFIGMLGEITVNTDSKSLHVHDGVTPGGFPLARQYHVNVKDYGAVGDGVTNDLPAFQAAVSAIPTATQGGYTIELPPGKYRLNGTLVVGLRRVIFKGPGVIGSNSATIIQGNKDVDLIDYSTGNLDTCSFDGIQFAGADATGTGRLLVLGSAGQPLFDSRITNCWFLSCPTYAIVGVNMQGCHITNCGFDSSASGTQGGIYLTYGSNNIISHNRFYGQVVGGLILKEGENNNLSSNEFDFSGTGETIGAITFDVTSTKVVRANIIASNTFRANQNDIVLRGNGGVNLSNTGVNDTLIIGNCSDRAYRRFALLTDSHNAQLVNNKINTPNQYEPSGSYDAIEVTGTCDSTYIDGNVVTFQRADAYRPPYGLRIGTSTTNTRLGKNDFQGKTGKYIIGAGATFAKTLGLSGSWTPTIKGYTTAGSHTYTTRTGKWRVSDGLVWAYGNIALSAKDAAMAGFVYIDQLPFAIDPTEHPVAASIGSYQYITLTAGTQLSLRSQGGVTGALSLVRNVSGAAFAAIQPSELANNSDISFLIVYKFEGTAFLTNGGLNTID